VPDERSAAIAITRFAVDHVAAFGATRRPRPRPVSRVKEAEPDPAHEDRPRPASAIAHASRLRQRQPRNARNWGGSLCKGEPEDHGELRSLGAAPSLRARLGRREEYWATASEQEACNKPCNKTGKFSLIQPDLKSENPCKTAPVLVP
jgi:hypothetical protein